MNPSFRTGAIAGFVAGAASIGVVLMILTSRPAPVEPQPKPPEPSASQNRVRELEEDNRRLSKKLAELELDENTVIFVTGDNGGLSGTVNAQGWRPGKKPDHSGGAGAQSGATGHQGKRSTK